MQNTEETETYLQFTDIEIDRSDQDEEGNQTKGKFTNVQRIIGEAINLLPPSVKKSIDQSEKHLKESIEKLTNWIKNNTQLANLGDAAKKTETEPIMQAILELIWLTECYFGKFKVSVDDELVGQALLLGFKAILNPEIHLDLATKIALIFNKFPFFLIDLDHITKYAHETSAWKSVYQILKKDYTLGERIALGTQKNQNFQVFLKVFRRILDKINSVFKDDFLEIAAVLQNEKKGLFKAAGTHSSIYCESSLGQYLVPISKLSRKNLFVLLKGVTFIFDYVSKHSLDIIQFVHGLSFNKEFEFTAHLGKTLTSAIFNCGTKLKRSSKAKLRFYSDCVGRLFGNLLFKKESTDEEFEVSLEWLDLTIDCFVNDIHPKEGTGKGDQLFRMALIKFSSYFFRKIHQVKDETRKAKIVEFFESLMIRVVNFGIFRNKWNKFGILLRNLCVYNKEKFASFILGKLKFGLENDEFAKEPLYLYLTYLIGIICQNEDLSENLQWILPKFRERLRDTSDNQEIHIICNGFAGVFEYFIGSDNSSDSDYPYLVEIKDDIDEVALKLFSYYIKKGNDITIPSSSFGALLNLGDYVLNKIMNKFKNNFKECYDSLKSSNIEMVISKLHELKPEQTEDIVKTWMNKSVWTKLSEPKSTEGMVLQKSISVFGIDSIEYKLKSENLKVLKKQIGLFGSLCENIYQLSNGMLKTIIKFYALCHELEEKELKSAAGLLGTNLQWGLKLKKVGETSKTFLKRAVKNKSEKIKNIKWVTPTDHNQKRVKQIFEAFVIKGVETVEDYMKKLLGNEEIIPLNHQEDVISIYKNSIKQDDQKQETKHLTNPLIEKFHDAFYLLNQSIAADFSTSQLLSSRFYVQFVIQFKQKVLGFLKQSHLFELDKIKSVCLSFLKFETKLTDNYLKTSYSCLTWIKALGMTSKSTVKGFRTYTQLNLARIIGLQFLNLAKILQEPAPGVFEAVMKDNEYLKSLNLTEFHNKSDSSWPQGSPFKNLFKEYLIDVNILQIFPQITPLMFNFNSTKSSYTFFTRLISDGPFVAPPQLTLSVFQSLIPYLKLECPISTDYNDIVLKVTYLTFMSFGNTISTLAEKDISLEIMHLITKNGNSNKCFPIVKAIGAFLLTSSGFGDQQVPQKEIEEKLIQLNKMKKEGHGDALALATDLILSLNTWGNDVQFLKTVFIKLAKQIESPDIANRVLISNLIIVVQALLNTHFVKTSHKIVSCDKVAGVDGLISAEQITEIMTEINFKLGYSTKGSADPTVTSSFGEIDSSYRPLSNPCSYYSPPFKFEKFEIVSNSHVTGDDLTTIIEVYKSYFKTLIAENQLETSSFLNSMTLTYKFIHQSMSYQPKLKNELKDKTLMFRKVLTSMFQNCGIAFYEAIKPIFGELRDQDLVSVQKFEQEFYTVALYVAGFSFNQADFETVATEIVQKFDSYMTEIFKNSQGNTLARFTWALKYTLSCGRINFISNLIDQIYNSAVTDTRKNYIMKLYGGLFGGSKYFISDTTRSILNNSFKEEKRDSTDDLSRIASIGVLLFQDQTATGYSLQKLSDAELNGKVNLVEKAAEGNKPIYSVFSKTNGFDLFTVFIQFLKKLEGENILSRITVTKKLAALFYGSNFSINKDTLDLTLQVLRLMVYMDSAEDHSSKAIVTAIHQMIPHLFGLFIISEDAKDQLLDGFEEMYEGCLKSNDKMEMFILGYCLFLELDLPNKRIDFLAKILGGLNVKLSVSGSDNAVYVLTRLGTKRLIQVVNYIEGQIEKIQDYKANNELMQGYAILLMNIVVAKKWELGEVCEKALKVIFKYKRKSPGIKKRYDYFISDFWKKRTSYVELSMHEFTEDVKEELDDYKVPYSYFA